MGIEFRLGLGIESHLGMVTEKRCLLEKRNGPCHNGTGPKTKQECYAGVVAVAVVAGIVRRSV